MNKIILVAICIVLSLSLKAQKYKEYIIKLNGDTIKCNITDVNDYYIFYTRIDIKKDKISLTEVNKFKMSNVETTINSISKNINSNEVNIKDSIYKSIVINNPVKVAKLNDSTFNVLNAKYKDLNNKVENINKNMFLCHKEFKNGTTTLITGTGVTIISLLIFANNPTRQKLVSSTYNIYETKVNAFPLAMIYVGSLTSLIGVIIQIDSHKHIGRGYNK